VGLVGYLKKNSITIHGNMNVKFVIHTPRPWNNSCSGLHDHA